MGSQRENDQPPILTQVEAQSPNLVSLGRARNLGLGGILIETPETLPQDAEVIVRFFVPPETQPVEAVGRVVRVETGKSMAIAFLDLPESYKKRLQKYLTRTQPAELLQELAAQQGRREQRRRSLRISRRIPVSVTWLDPEGRPRQEAAETKLLSRHGALLDSYSHTRLEPGKVLCLSLPEGGDEVRSRVVYTTPAEQPGRTCIAIEFIGVDNFWDVSFSADTVTLQPTRRRSARQRKTVPVELSWETSTGVRHKEATETLDISQHGAGLTAVGTLPAGRLLQVRLPDSGQVAAARVVWCGPSTIPGRTQMGVEILNRENFWGIQFPNDRDFVLAAPREQAGSNPGVLSSPTA